MTAGGKSLQKVAAITDKMAGECTTMAFSPDGAYLAVGDAERHLRLFKVEGTSDGGDGAAPKLTETNDWRSHAARVTSVAWTPDSSHIATGGLDCALIIFKPGASTKVCEVRSKLALVVTVF